MNEKKNLELYNFLIKELSLIQLYKIEEEVSKKEELIEKLEKELMDELNFFENVNFSRINYFYKDYYPGANLRVVLILKDGEDKLFLLKNSGNCYKILNSLVDINSSIPMIINELKARYKIESKEKEYLKSIIYREPLRNNNIYYPIPENLLIFTLKVDKISSGEFIKVNKKDLMNSDKYLLNKEINNLDFDEILSVIDDKNEVYIK